MKLTKREAVERMVKSEFNAIPLSIIEKAYTLYEDMEKITTNIRVGEYVYDHMEDMDGIIKTIDRETGEVELECGHKTTVDNIEVENVDYITWGTVWFTDYNSMMYHNIMDNLDEVAEIGFIVYEIDEGIVLGIDGGGYNFYDAHWIPLYDMIGLKWHSEEEE